MTKLQCGGGAAFAFTPAVAAAAAAKPTVVRRGLELVAQPLQLALSPAE